MTTTTTTNGYSGGYKANGSAAGAPFRKQPPSPLPHIDDIMNVTIDYDPHLPTNKLLGYADDLLRQAENRRTFSGRIDIALTLYVKALLVFDLMRKTKGWETLADNRAQKEKYNKLCKQVEALESVYQQIKLDIKADNLRTGVQPMRQQSQPPVPHSTNTATAGSLPPKDHNRSPHEAGYSNGSQTPGFSTLPAKTKPTVRPKPEALHGHALHPVDGVAKTPPKRAADDLTARFSKLRATTSPPRKPAEQDPRIRTHPLPVIPAHSTDCRDAALSTGRPSLSIDSNLFELPKVPGAIYKPARGTVSTEAAELPSSSSRRFSVARSLTSGSLNSPLVKSPTGGGNIPEEPNDWVKRTTPTIPEGDILSVTDLLTLMKEGSKSVSILLIDIRSREAFDEGHIMSQATICIEPEVLRRKDISATEIADSMVLAPSAEQLNFERRHQFDVIVFYDQSSMRIGTNKGDLAGLAVQGLYNALTHFDFGGGEAKPKPPKLLQGGLEAWTSVMGNNSLATTESSVGQPHRSPKLSSHPPARRQSFAPKPIQDAAEARRWEESTNDIETYKNYAREVDDVLRGFDKRFPKVPESMTSVPATAPSNGTATYSSHHPAVPSEPERPRPTRAKSTTFGLSSSEDPQAAIKPGRKGPGGNRSDRKRVGLVNPANLCYANASLQALFHTPGFAEDLFRGGWERDYRVPMKSGEKIPNPQLLAKMLAQLFAWMDKALIHPLEARTLMVSSPLDIPHELNQTDDHSNM
ncbi:hypothetical protein GE09DRAFT_1107113 [Coniochaeta sp. 2T2.1]|nr:hypothetical protein GE09DRAFT_1107113 [Coniochaeta sp. 2T2.1]